jgi:Uma2 family endonuclease
MTTAVRKTFDDLMATPDDGYRYELVRGEILRMPPPKGERGYVEAALVEAMGRYLYNQALELGWSPGDSLTARNRLVGRLASGEVGIRVSIPTDPDQVRGLDFACYSAEQVRRIGIIAPDAYTPEAPAIVAEVISPSETASYIEDKVADYFAAGAQLVWLIFPTRRSVRVCLPDGTTFTVPPDGVLDGGTVLPEFTVPLRDLFAAQ